MLVERRKVTRKTPLDGKLEITKVGAARLGGLGDGFEIALGHKHAPARLGTMECTCRGPELPHVHYFLESPLLKELEAGSEVELELEGPRNRIRVTAI